MGRNGETIGEICDKYFAATDICSTEDRMRVLRFLENICLGSSAVGYRTESMHGAGFASGSEDNDTKAGRHSGQEAAC